MKLNDYEKEHLLFLRSHLADCTVLLKQNGAFPLAGPCRIAAYGNGVRHTVKGGTGSGEVNSRYRVNVSVGLARAGFTVTTRAWLDAYDEEYAKARKAFLAELKKESMSMGAEALIANMGRIMPEPEYDLPLDAEGDAAIYVLSRISGEGKDRSPIPGDVMLTASEIRDILALNDRFEKFMLILNTGGPVDLTPVMEVGNILVLSQLGVETGDAVAELLTGRQNPSGKLTTTWASWQDYADVGSFGGHNDTCYKEGVYVGYRWFDATGRKPLFPFGHGLSYTTFSLTPGEVTLSGGEVTAAVSVTNTGKLAGREVAEVYLAPPAGRIAKPPKALAGFAKTRLLSPGETEKLTITFPLRDLATFDEASAAYLLEAGSYVVSAGSCSAHTLPAAILDLPEEITVRRVRSALGSPGFADWEPAAQDRGPLPENVPVLTLSPEAIPTEEITYDAPEEVEEAVKALSDDELITLNIGSFDPKAGALSVIGNASQHVAGAAGETTGTLKDKGFPVLVMADGPAGLRLSKSFYRDAKGAHGIGSSLPEGIADLLPGPVRLALSAAGGLGTPRGAKIEEQFCTAIPIGTAIAQSWDLAFARACGDIVGDEMERFGVHLWLAPALNIHRSILCGRNFEYFSEDPVISGLFAAAITQGVQAHPGCGTTIKHFAANNQEENRYGNCSHVSQRAMREIYLRGFEIAVRESQPKALMTSYNLLNGVHTAERRDLTQDILRAEFGFRGIVMTDWVISMMTSKKDIYAPTAPHKVAAAGGDLFMPGSQKDFEEMRAALREGTLTRAQLEANATRVLRMARALTGSR